MSKGQITFVGFILCPKCVLSCFKEKSLGFGRKEDFKTRFQGILEVWGSPSIKQRKIADDTAVQRGCTAVHPRQKLHTDGRPGSMVVPRLCRDTRPLVHLEHGRAWWRTVGRASWHGCAGANPCLAHPLLGLFKREFIFL